MLIGTKVEVTLDDGSKWITETRSEPWELGSGHKVVMLKGKSGGYSFDRVKPVDPKQTGGGS